MTYLGIDFGTKKIGLALSDKDGRIAFPHRIIANNASTLDSLEALIKERHVDAIVMGESVDQAGGRNKVASLADDFASQLHLITGLDIIMQQETFTSVEARLQFAGYGKGATRRRQANLRGRTSAPAQIDAHAAALILQRYLDKQNN